MCADLERAKRVHDPNGVARDSRGARGRICDRGSRIAQPRARSCPLVATAAIRTGAGHELTRFCALPTVDDVLLFLALTRISIGTGLRRSSQQQLSCARALLFGLLAMVALANAAAQSETRSARPSRESVAPALAQDAGAPGASETALRRVALVIGNGSYRHMLPLTNPLNDADDLCAALRRLGFEATCLKDLASRFEMRRALLSFGAKLEPGVVGVVYYAGHGIQSQGRNYLLPTGLDARERAELEGGSLALDEVFTVLREARSALNVIILDACRDDPFADTGRVQVARGLAREEPPVNSVLVYATAPGSVAADGDSRNGLFTSHLLAELERPGPQIGEMLRNVALKVEHEARSRFGLEQVPYRSFSFSGAFCFAECDDTVIAREMQSLREQRDRAQLRIQQLEQERAMKAEPGVADPQTLNLADAAGVAREAEIAALRSQLSALGAKATELEAYRQRIAALEREAREKDRQISEGLRRDEVRRSRPTGIPTF